MPQLPERFAGSISEATLNPKHLIPRFVAVLEQADPSHPLVSEWREVERATVTLAEWMGWDDPADYAEDGLNLFDAERASYFLNDSLFDALNEVAPEGTYFGSAEGDGASFGFWDMPEDEG